MGERFDILKFLEEYQRFPCLWKKNSPDFKNRVKRDHAEELLLPLSGLSNIKELRQKIRSIRCTYNQEVSKVKKSMGTGTGTSDVYKPKLVWFSLADSFLRQNLEENESDSNMTLPGHSSEASQGDENPTEADEESMQPPDTQSDSQVTPITAGKSRKRPASSTSRSQTKNKVDESLDNAVKVLQQVATQSSSVNEFTIFGQHIASQLQSLPLEEALTLQEDIQKLITAARLRHIRRSNSQLSNYTSDSSSSCYASAATYQPPTPRSSEVPLDTPFCPGTDPQYSDMDGREEISNNEPHLVHYFGNWTGGDTH